jgi:hypothetical protein
MPDWDEDSPLLSENLRRVLRGIRDSAARRDRPSVAWSREWHRGTMLGLTVPDDEAGHVGRFRGEPGIEDYEVAIGPHRGARADSVADELEQFERQLRAKVAALDALIAPGDLPDESRIMRVIEACAWAHAEWVRIHPFANGNGRTARLWANALAMRYGLPPFVRLRPRPDGGYGLAGYRAMTGDWRSTVPVFERMLLEYLESGRPPG